MNEFDFENLKLYPKCPKCKKTLEPGTDGLNGFFVCVNPECNYPEIISLKERI